MSVPRAPASAWSPLHSRDFVLYQAARLLLTVGVQMQNTAMAWYVYDLTHRPLDLGFVGLAQFLPAVTLALVTGHAADRFERQRILLCCFGALSACAALFFVLARTGSHSLVPLYGVLALVGTARAFSGPAAQSFLPHLVPEGHLARGVAYGASVFQVAQIAGPALGGVLYGVAGRATPVFGASAAFILVSTACIAAIRARSGRMEARAASWPLLVEGVRYVWRQKAILGSISMDLFAVLLGGAVALLPIYARDILHTGPWGLGVLRSAPAVGAGAMAILLGTRPLKRRAGLLMLGCVALFGAGTIVFGVGAYSPLGMRLKRGQVTQWHMQLASGARHGDDPAGSRGQESPLTPSAWSSAAPRHRPRGGVMASAQWIRDWPGGWVRRARGREVFVIERSFGCRRYAVTLDVRTERDALAELALFECDPANYSTRRQVAAARAPGSVCVDAATAAHLAQHGRTERYLVNVRHSLAEWADALAGRDLWQIST